MSRLRPQSTSDTLRSCIIHSAYIATLVDGYLLDNKSFYVNTNLVDFMCWKSQLHERSLVVHRIGNATISSTWLIPTAVSSFQIHLEKYRKFKLRNIAYRSFAPGAIKEMLKSHSITGLTYSFRNLRSPDAFLQDLRIASARQSNVRIQQ